MKRIRVLVVEDSLTVRRHLVDVLGEDPELEVVGEAVDGRRGVEMCREIRPDVVTLDMMLPVMSGLAATELIMAYCPTPILIVSASLNRGEVFKTFEALKAGAVDVLEKPTGGEADLVWERKLRAAVKLCSRIRVITHPRARLSLRDLPGFPAGTAAPDAAGRSGAPDAAPDAPGRSGAPDAAPPAAPVAAPPVAAAAAEARRPVRLAVIGASTGGPPAVLEVLRGAGRGFPVPILVVVHVARDFGRGLADWLDGQSPLRVSLAEDGEPLPRPGEGDGRAFLAPPERHLVVRDGRLRLNDEPERHSCRPSVDVLFDSVAREAGPASVACLLTGMGRDGAAGLLAVRRAGGVTIAQDEATCVVYGMPREAVLLGAAARVLPVGEIGPALRALAVGSREGRP